MGLVTGPHARTPRTHSQWVVGPGRTPERTSGRGLGERPTPDAPHPGKRRPPPGTLMPPPQHARARAVGLVTGPHPRTPRTHSQWVVGPGRTPERTSGRGWESARPRTPHTQARGAPPPGALVPPPKRAKPARKSARCGVGDGRPRPHPRTHSQWVVGPGCTPEQTRGREPRLPAPQDRRPGEGQRLTPGAPHNGGMPPPPGDSPPPPPRQAAPTGQAGQGDSVGPPHPHKRAHSTWVVDPTSPPSGRAVGGGTAPDLRRPSRWWKAPPPGMPYRHPHSEQRRPARAHAVGPVLGPHARTDSSRDTQAAEPRLTGPEDERPGEGQRLTPDAPHNGGRPPPPGTAPHHPRGMQPAQGMQAKGTVLGPHSHTPAPTARGWRTPTARPVGGQSGEGQRLPSDAPHNGGRHPPQGRPSATPTASNAGPQGRTLWGRCWVRMPAPTASGTHGSRNPGCPLQRTGGRGGDSA